MMPSPFEFLVLILALSGIVDVWFQGSLFAGTRAMLEEWDPALTGGRTPVGREILICPYCLNHHVGWLVLALFVGGTFLPPGWELVAHFPVYWIALVRSAWILQGILPHTRYDRTEELDDDVIDPDPERPPDGQPASHEAIPDP